jgi:hypothetical protein
MKKTTPRNKTATVSPAPQLQAWTPVQQDRLQAGVILLCRVLDLPHLLQVQAALSLNIIEAMSGTPRGAR